jgi:hypothetical protein
MMKYVLTAFAVLALAPIARGQQPAETKKTKQGQAAGEPVEMKKTKQGQAAGGRTMKVKAKVKAVNVANRTITVWEEDGTTETFMVGPEVKRLNEIAAGDTIVVQFHQGLMLQVTPPDQTQPSGVVASGRGPADKPPSGAVAGAVQGTVTIVAIDPKTRIVVLQTDSGDMFKVKAGKEIQLDRVKAGDKLWGTYTEALAISVEKATPSGPPKTN